MISDSERQAKRVSKPGTGTKAVPPFDDAAETRNFLPNLSMGLYASSIIIGAGLLTVPLVAAYAGATALLATIVALGFYMIMIYTRLAGCLFDTRRLNQKIPGHSLFAAALWHCGYGRTGQHALTWAMLLYVLPADVGYIIIGSRTFNAIVPLLNETRHMSPLIPLALSILCFVGVQQYEAIFKGDFLLRGTLKKICAMLGMWLLSITMLLALHDVTSQQSQAAIGIFAFFSTVVVTLLVRVSPLSNASDTPHSGLTDQHRVNLFMVLILIGLLLLSTIFIIFLGLQQHQLQADTLLDFRLPGVEEWSRLVGVVIFAFVGTGIFNLSQYSNLFERKNGRAPRITQVVIIGGLIPIAVYLLWTVVSLLVLDVSDLARLDTAKEYTTIGISHILGETSDRAEWLILFSGYSMALLAVTSACNGFTESLANQFHNWRQLKSDSSEMSQLDDRVLHRTHITILVLAMGIAMIIEPFDSIDLSSILAVSGNAGGGLLLLILPYFLPKNGHKKASWLSILVMFSTLIILAFLSILAIGFASINTLTGWIVAIITLGIIFSIGFLVYLLLKSEPS